MRLTLHPIRPDGTRRPERVTAAKWHAVAVAIGLAEDHVRESAYNLVRLLAYESGDASVTWDNNHGEAYSRAAHLYRRACDALRTLDPDADAFINATYRPALGQKDSAHDDQEQ